MMMINKMMARLTTIIMVIMIVMITMMMKMNIFIMTVPMILNTNIYHDDIDDDKYDDDVDCDGDNKEI